MSKGSHSDEILIDPSDFKGIEVRFSILNSTTRTSFSHPEKISLIEFDDTELTLEVSKKNCSSGHNLIIDVEAQGTGKFVKFSMTAKVLEVAPTSGGDSDMIQVQLLQYKTEEWDAFISLFTDRQKEIEDFLAATRGW